MPTCFAARKYASDTMAVVPRNPSPLKVAKPPLNPPKTSGLLPPNPDRNAAAIAWVSIVTEFGSLGALMLLKKLRILAPRPS
jgi:hypothetical protein